MNYLSYKTCDVNNGKGVRNVVWLSGCSHGCKGCFQPESHNPRNGEPVTEDFIQQLINDTNKPYIRGVTLTGGDPLYKRNYEEVIKLCQKLKHKLPNKSIWLWTGYTLEQIQNDLLRQPILSCIDVLVDGKFELGLSKNPPPFRGSSNQRAIHLENGVPVRFE